MTTLWFLKVLFIILGLVFGSFGSVLIARVPRGQSIAGRSHCPHCHHLLGATDLVPLLSFLYLRGRCRHCGSRISLQYLLLECVSAGLFLGAFVFAQSVLPSFFLALIFWLLLLVSLTDIQTHTIPDSINLPLVLCAAVYAVLAHTFTVPAVLIPPFFFGAQWILSRGRWVGSADIFIAVAMGLLAGGVAKAFLMIGLSYIFGSVLACILLLAGRATRKSRMPFAPFLALATVTVLFLGDRLVTVLTRGLY